MKDELEKIFYMGLGAMSITSDKAKEIRDDLLEKGKKAYSDGKDINEELKHNLKSKLGYDKKDVIDAIKNMSEDDKKEVLDALKEKKAKKDEK